MVQHLPDDVWSQIAEVRSGRGTLHSMSLTSKRMHQVVVPVLFRHLQFHIFRADFKSLMVRLIRNNTRARFLFTSPELLRHTRVFWLGEIFYTLDSIAEYLALHEGSESPSSRGDAENLLAVLHDAIFRLISRMPGLRELQISNTVITPLCYAAISSRPLLTSLHLEPRLSPDITHVTPAPPYALRLRDLTYYDTWTDNDRPTDPYLTDILEHYMLDLEKLAMSSILLPLVFSHIPLHHALSLQSLSVQFPFYSSDGLEAVALLQILRACPQLRLLDVSGEFPDVEATHCLPPPNLPNLSICSGTSRLLQILSGGANLVKILVNDNFYVKEQTLTQVILSPPTHLRELSMGLVMFSQTPHEFLRFIQSLAVFRNLERLDIAYEHGMSWKDNVSAQESHDAIKYLLSQLACLRFINIHSDPYDPVEGFDIGCPISKEGEPTNRGHPSLEGIYVDFICGMWSWDSRTGWEMSNWALP